MVVFLDMLFLCRCEFAIKLLKCLLGASVVAVGSQICIPLIPVPFTLQTLSVFFVAYALGAKLGTFAVLIYLIEGVAGVPVFANFSSGMSVILGPTGGYLIGFVPLVFLLGFLLDRLKNVEFLLVLMVGFVSNLILLTIGYLRLAHFIGFYDAYALGVLPFIIGDFLKLTVFSVIISKKCIRRSI
jgi:biotin transport system substrate-specific component